MAARRIYDLVVCKIEGCGRPRNCRGWCATHYRRWRTHGDPMKVRPRGRGKGHKGSAIHAAEPFLRAPQPKRTDEEVAALLADGIRAFRQSLAQVDLRLQAGPR
jgi:hypothetical protein